MSSFGETRELLVESYLEGDIDEDEFDLLYDANTSKNPGAFTIYTIRPSGNFRCKHSVLQLVETQFGKIRICTSINWKVQKEKKKCMD